MGSILAPPGIALFQIYRIKNGMTETNRALCARTRRCLEMAGTDKKKSETSATELAGALSLMALLPGVTMLTALMSLRSVTASWRQAVAAARYYVTRHKDA